MPKVLRDSIKLACYMLTFFALSEPALADYMTVTLKSTNTQQQRHQFEVYDRVCQTTVGTWWLSGGQSRQIRICENSAGYGEVMIRNPDLNNDWVGISWIRPGDEITR